MCIHVCDENSDLCVHAHDVTELFFCGVRVCASVVQDEVWNNVTVEIEPHPETGDAQIAWTWSVWDHLVQDHDSTKKNYYGPNGIKEHPELFDINYCPPGGSSAVRNRDILRQVGTGPSMMPGTGATGNSHGLQLPPARKGEKTGERDWLHINGISYSERRNQLVMSMNVPCEVCVSRTRTRLLTSHEECVSAWNGQRAHLRSTRIDELTECTELRMFLMLMRAVDVSSSIFSS